MKYFECGFLALAISAASLPLTAGADGNFTPSNARNNDIIPSRDFTVDQHVSLDAVKSRQLTNHGQTPFQSTGYYVRKGEVLNLAILYGNRDMNPSLEAFITVPDDRTYEFGHSQRQKLQWGINSIQADQDGILYIANLGKSIDGDIAMQIHGGHPFPRFILNQNHQGDWKRMLADAELNNSPYVELLSDRMMITLRREKAAQFIENGDPISMLATWDNIIKLAENQYGLTNDDPSSRHPAFPYHFHIVEGIPPTGIVNNDKCAGSMNTGRWRIQTCYENSMKEVINNHALQTDGWGPWHELGHNLQMAPLTWGGMTEVTVNLTSLYIQREFGMTSRLETDGVWGRAFSYLQQSQRDYNAQDNWVKVAMLWQLDLTFGKDFYATLARHYREMDDEDLPRTDDQKIQHFIVQTSRMSHFNLIPFFEQWGLMPSDATRKYLAQRSASLPLLQDPIWENRDVSVKYDYAEKELKAVTDADVDLNVLKVSNSYPLDGNASKNAVSFKWSMVSGQGTFGLKDKRGNDADEVNDAVAQAWIPANVTGEAVYRLTVTDTNGSEASRDMKFTVAKGKG
ncbi:M60 family metallopeptidase [Pantoea cypripedii]|uniref:M60 family metallopeptidase n=1 Tax=Pantoea cypripedii TaxID=55209 RepID=UPI002FCBEC20